MVTQALAGVAQWIEHWPTNQKVTGSIPSQGTCLGCGPGPWLGGMREATDCFSHTSMFLSVSLPTSLPSKSKKKQKKPQKPPKQQQQQNNK